jgi:radical SAM superfamily enzyme YgiQ (UPF0313 family)
MVAERAFGSFSQTGFSTEAQAARPLRALLVDLNNFATFPTLAIGLLVARLRQAGHAVTVLCPLNHAVPGTTREHRDTWRDDVARRIHLSTWAPLLAARGVARAARERWVNRPNPVVLRETARALAEGPDVLLLSAYLQHHPTVLEIGRLAQRAGTPLVLGGPMFNVTSVAEAWRNIPGLTAIVGAEADFAIDAIVEAACGRGELLAQDGVVLPDGRRSPGPRPLRELDRTLVPDFTDFPWALYPFRVVPVMTGRGCQWDRCVFCSDVVSANGRSFRTRSVEHVMAELREQARRHDTCNFLFLDLKLNSNPNMLRGISANIQRVVPGAEWIGTVHVDLRRDNGLSRPELEAAVAAGMRRVSFGLESGSQRLLDAMDKGSSVAANSAFIRDAHAAGLSVRCTMFRGFPGEAAADMELTADFLERHAPWIDRVLLNEFSIYEDTPINKALRERSPDYPEVTLGRVDPRYARGRGAHAAMGGRAYRRAMDRTLRAVHAINRRDVRPTAQAFHGLW